MSALPATTRNAMACLEHEERERFWQNTHLSLGASMLMGSVMENTYDAAAMSLRLAEARLENSPAKMQAACEELTELSQRVMVLSATLGRAIARHRKRNPLAGVR